MICEFEFELEYGSGINSCGWFIPLSRVTGAIVSFLLHVVVFLANGPSENVSLRRDYRFSRIHIFPRNHPSQNVSNTAAKLL
jgi:hypothetical protein